MPEAKEEEEGVWARGGMPLTPLFPPPSHQVREPTAEERGPAREAARATFDGILRSLRKRVFEAYEDREGQPRVFRRNKNGVIRPAEALAAPVHAVREAGEAGGGDGDGRCGEEASPAEEARS